MNISKIKKIAVKAKDGVKYIAEHPKIAQSVKIVGEAVKNHQDKKVAAQERIDELAADVCYLKAEVRKIEKLMYIAIGTGVATLIASIVTIFC